MQHFHYLFNWAESSTLLLQTTNIMLVSHSIRILIFIEKIQTLLCSKYIMKQIQTDIYCKIRNIHTPKNNN